MWAWLSPANAAFRFCSVISFMEVLLHSIGIIWVRNMLLRGSHSGLQLAYLLQHRLDLVLHGEVLVAPVIHLNRGEHPRIAHAECGFVKLLGEIQQGRGIAFDVG